MKKVCSVILCAVLLIGVIPFTQRAEAGYIKDVIYSFDFTTDAIVEGFIPAGKQGGSLPAWFQDYNVNCPDDAEPKGVMASETYGHNDNGNARTDAYLYTPWVEVPVSEYGISYIYFNEMHDGHAGAITVGYQVEGEEEIKWICSEITLRTPLNQWQEIHCNISQSQSAYIGGKNIRFVIRHWSGLQSYNGGRTYIDNVRYLYENYYNPIEHVDISGWSAPVPNGTPSTVFDLEPDEPKYYVSSIKWHRSNSNDAVTKFEPGHSYWAEICVIGNDNYVFKYTGKKGLDQFSEGVFLNEESDYIDYDKSYVFLPDSRESHARLMIYTKPVELPLYNEVVLNGTPGAVVGWNANSTPTRVYSADNDNYTVTSAKWYKHSGSSYTEFSGTFQQGEKYSVKVVISPRGLTTIASGAKVKTSLGTVTGTLDGTGKLTAYLPDITPAVPASMVSGKCGDCKWSFNTSTGQMTVSGTGEFYPAVCDECDFYDYIGDVKTLIIDEGVTSIGDSTFMDCGSLKSVWLADSITEISYDCFQWCDNLAELKLPANLVSVGNGSFSAISITELDLPDTLRYIDNGAFSLLWELSSLTLNEGIEHIGAWCFSDCPNIKEVTVPASLNFLGEKSLGVDGDGNPYSDFRMHTYMSTPAFAYQLYYKIFGSSSDNRYGCHVTGSYYPFESELKGSDRMVHLGDSKYSFTMYTDRALDNARFLIKMVDPDAYEMKRDENGYGYFTYDEAYVKITPWNCAVSTDGPGYFTIYFDYPAQEITVEGSHVTSYGVDESILSAIWLNGYEKPVAGKKVSDIQKATLRGANIYLQESYWYCDSTSTKLDDDSVFEAGKQYSFCWKIRTHDGYTFDPDGVTVTINGDTELVDTRWSGPDSSYTLYTVWSVSEEPEAGGEDIKYGDVNGDGKVNGQDLVRLRKYLNGENVVIGPGANVNGDAQGKVNGQDLIRLRKYLNGENVVLGPN